MSGSYALIGNSAIIRHVQHLVFKIAESNSTVLITGEQGTGKEIIAKMIHDSSQRKESSFVPVKCGAFNEEMLEIELVGVEPSSVSSNRRSGCFVQAQDGTIFIDEVSKLTPKLQNHLLRLLQENQLRPVNSAEDVSISCRVICATSVDLETLVRRGAFREDLYYKLSGSSIYLPPLRERREDIPTLAEFFIQKFNQLKSKKISGISHDAMNALLQNNWVNNIQELENLIERIVVLKNAGSIEICDLPPRLRNLVTDNIDTFYDKQSAPQNQFAPQSQMPSMSHSQTMAHYSSPKSMGMNHKSMPNQNVISMPTAPYQRPMGSTNTGGYSQANYSAPVNLGRMSMMEDFPSEIDQFIKKEIDLGAGIDFYRVVEEFENRLISEALRRTNHNKNRAAQLLSMNRTTLVEKLKKRASTTSIKTDGGKVKRNSSFTIFDGLGSENREFEGIDYLNVSGDDL